ncbi:MAG: TonB-dependent receptor [Pseudomonadota bacterium]
MARKFKVLVGVAAAPLVMPAQALAQSGDAPLVMDEILVEARLFAEPVGDVPGRLDLVLPEDLLARPRLDLGDVTKDTPNVTFQKTNADERLVIRGITSFPTALADPTAVVVNGVALPLGTIQAPNIFALDRAAVLVGPQGAHYGRNSEAGLIDLEFLGPGDLLGGTFSLGGAEHESVFGTLLVGAEFGRVGAILGIDADRTGGEITNTVTGDNDGGQSERLTGLLGLSLESDGGMRFELTSVLEAEESGKEQFRFTDGAFATPRFESNYNDRSTESRRSSVTSFRVDDRIGGLDFRSTTGFTTFDREFDLDFDTSPAPTGVTVLDLDDWLISQEFRLSSPPDSGGPLSWSAGASVFHEVTDTVFNLGSFATNRTTDIDQTGLALFGFAEYALTDRLRLGAGGRLDYLRQEGAQDFTSPFAALSYSATEDTLTFLPKVTVAYDVTEEVLLYANASRGYLAGGFNYNFANSAESFTFDSEFSTTVEVGTRIEHGAVAVDLAGFYTDVRDKQIVEVIPGGAQNITNAARVRTFGAEGTLEVALTDTLSVDASVGYLNAEATSFETTVFAGGGLAPADFSGNDLTFAPSVTYGAGISYKDDSGFFGKARVNGSTGYFFDAANTLEQSGFATVDFEIGYSYENITLSIFATNLFDQDFFTTALNTALGTLVEDGPGRQVGAQLDITW